MICEYCGAELSAGDISVIDMVEHQAIWGVVCHKCDKKQSSKVSVNDSGVFVVRRGE